MTSKEKVQLALQHKSGPVPLDIGLLPTTGIHVLIMERLRDFYGLKKRVPIVLEPYQMLGMVEDDLREAIGIDTKPLWSPWTMYGFKNEDFKEWKTPWGQIVQVARDFVTTEDDHSIYIYAKGDKNYKPAGEMPKTSFFFDATIRQYPVDDEALNVEDNLEEFGPISDDDLAWYRKTGTEMKNSPYFVGGNLGGTAIGDIACVPGPMLPDPKGIRDVQEWYISTALRPDYLHEIFEKQTDIAIENLKKMYTALGDSIGLAYICGNDFGTQGGPFCSNATFQNLYAPYYKRINDWIHSHTTWKTFKHSCGSIQPLIPEMIAVGFDILNPVQWTAKNMDPQTLKREYGKDIVFWGAGVDTQKTLPFGTPAEVREEVLHMCEVFSKDGGFVFNTVHNILANTPIVNLVAMIDALKEFNR